MANKISFFLLLTVLSGFFIISCDNSKTYAELVADERKSIENYIKTKGITVIKEFPKDSIFKENEYFLDEDGLYIHIDTLGGRRLVRTGEEVLLWYTKKGPLPKDTVYTSNVSNIYPDDFTYLGNYTNAALAIVRPLRYVGNYGRVKLIAPHRTGTTTDQNAVAPFAYEVEYILTGFDE